ncbi:MAG TPA: MurR/RpiR family transcriptional regulator [Candidatus Cybelea sp.]|nr:MurR/RpiR family transcriptional regulator [Candidatus Cybelea sp.]
MTVAKARAKSVAPDAAEHLAALRARIAERYDGLSNRLQQIAKFVLDHPNDIALETVVVIAERAGVPPSALIRFAQALGYTGFREMQRVFQAPLASRSPSYAERVRSLALDRSEQEQDSLHHFLARFCAASAVALEHIQEVLTPEQLGHAVELLVKAKQVYVVAQRRSFPVAAYLAYALPHSEKPTHLLDGLGGMLDEQVRSIQPDDALIAISFSPYAPETASIVERAASRRASVIVISDSMVSPISRFASVFFEIKDAEVQGFRSLTASLCLAQTLAVGLAMRSGAKR